MSRPLGLVCPHCGVPQQVPAWATVVLLGQRATSTVWACPRCQRLVGEPNPLYSTFAITAGAKILSVARLGGRRGVFALVCGNCSVVAVYRPQDITVYDAVPGPGGRSGRLFWTCRGCLQERTADGTEDQVAVVRKAGGIVVDAELVSALTALDADESFDVAAMETLWAGVPAPRGIVP